jgi:hypothetical protein
MSTRRKIDEQPSEPAARPRTRKAKAEPTDVMASGPTKPSARRPSRRPPPAEAASTIELPAPPPDAVRELAYLLAERNGFAGDPTFYWTLAEHELHTRRA